MKNLYLIKKNIKQGMKLSVQYFYRIFPECFNCLVIEIKGEYPYES